MKDILCYGMIQTIDNLDGGIQKMNKIKDEKGITLISLVVTIIILLILARGNNSNSNGR